ncbi:hypothetical protein ACF0H5_017712 [Mactra antiquata]
MIINHSEHLGDLHRKPLRSTEWITNILETHRFYLQGQLETCIHITYYILQVIDFLCELFNMEGSVYINIFIHLLLYFNNIIQGQAEILSCGIFPFIIPYNTNDSECIVNQVVPRTTEASTQENIYCGYSPIPYDANKRDDHPITPSLTW